MIDVLKYTKELDKIEEEFIKKVSDDSENMVKYIRELILNAAIFGTATGRNEITRLSHKKIAMSEGVWAKVMYSGVDEEDIKKAKGTLDRSAEFWDEYSLKIAGKYSQDRLNEASKILKSAVEEGLTQREIEKKLAEALQIWDKKRLSDIARVETTKCFNYGRIESFRENAKKNGIVRAVKFRAIMDDRVTDICRARNNLILDINDPRIDQNTAPLHIGCRSMWEPVDKWEYDEKYKNKSSSGWDEADVIDTQPGDSWGNPFAYGGKKEKNIKLPLPEIVEKGFFSKVKDEQILKGLKTTFKDSPKEIRDIITKYSDELEINVGKSNYHEPGMKRVTISKSGNNPYILSHEIGHYIDNIAHWEKDRGNVMYKYQHISYNEYSRLDGFTKSKFQEEMDNAIKNINGKTLKAKELRKQIDEDMKRTFSEEELRKREYSSIQDILEGITKCKLEYKYGHGARYWKTPGAAHIETFAHLFRMFANKGKPENDKMLEFTRKYMPEVVAAFEEFLKTGGI